LKSDQGQLFVANFVKELRAGKVEAFLDWRQAIRQGLWARRPPDL
jgi:hypothetical protein